MAILFRDMHIDILLFMCSMRFIRRVFLFEFEVCDKPFVKGMFYVTNRLSEWCFCVLRIYGLSKECFCALGVWGLSKECFCVIGV